MGFLKIAYMAPRCDHDGCNKMPNLEKKMFEMGKPVGISVELFGNTLIFILLIVTVWQDPGINVMGQMLRCYRLE